MHRDIWRQGPPVPGLPEGRLNTRDSFGKSRSAELCLQPGIAQCGKEQPGNGMLGGCRCDYNWIETGMKSK